MNAHFRYLQKTEFGIVANIVAKLISMMSKALAGIMVSLLNSIDDEAFSSKACEK